MIARVPGWADRRCVFSDRLEDDEGLFVTLTDERPSRERHSGEPMNCRKYVRLWMVAEAHSAPEGGER